MPTAGIIAALWTPTDAQGRVIETGLAANLAFLRQRGVHGLMVLGSTGEFARLSLEARLDFLAAVQRHCGDWPAMANVSDIRPDAVTALGRRAAELGYSSISLLPPWYYPLAQVDLAEFFVREAERIALPLFLYNFPERTGHRISLETIATVADRVPLAGIKQSGAEFSYHRELLALGRPRRFVVLTGADSRLAEAMALGVTGAVSGLANAVPELMTAVYDAVRAGDTARVNEATGRLVELTRRLDAVEFPLCVAAAMAARDLCVGEPKCVVSAATRQRYDQLVTELRQLFHEWSLR